ncbi:ribonucleoprotein complex subunit [Acrasis kona]|uniref:Ribonucleoprotein complex subunit n=1 Tax=Acrasis kona TaxID=1008807 RepID=A0AAW2YHJ5_9EUKA
MSTNFFSLLEDSSSSDLTEIARKRLAQEKPKVTAAAKKEEAPVQQQENEQQQGDRPQSSRGERGGRGRGGRPQGRPREDRPPREPRGDGEERRGGRGGGRGDRPPREPREQRDGEESTGRGGGRGRAGPRTERTNDETFQRHTEDRPRRNFTNAEERPRKVINEDGEVRPSGGRGRGRGGDRYARENDETRPPRQNREDRPEGESRHRQFDRSVSGTGRGRGMKKGGEGSHNWGKDGEGDDRRGDRVFYNESKVVAIGDDKLIEGVTAPIENAVSSPTDETAAEQPAQEGDASATPAPAVEEEVQLSLDDYKKQLAEKRKALPNAKPEPEVKAVEKKKKTKKEPKAGEAQSIQTFLADRADELQRKADEERSQRYNKHNNRQNQAPRKKQQPAPSHDDLKAFPSLGSK